MKGLMKARAKGLREELAKFSRKVDAFDAGPARVGGLVDLVSEEMRVLGFDGVSRDRSGNLIGVIKGRGPGGAVVILSHIDVMTPNDRKMEGIGDDSFAKYKAGIVSSVYAGALMKRTLLPLSGDLIVCCVPRLECCDYGIKYLFNDHLKARQRKIKGVILSEPTGFNVNLGHKGRMEYEIVVKGKLNRNFLEHRGMNMLGTMFPLIHELEKVSKDLPSDLNLGRSDLRIKDVRYSGYQPQDEVNEFRVVVDRVFIPEESEGYILNKAKTIAKTVYKQTPDVSVNTLLAKERVKTYTGLELVSEKEFKPWSMESHQPFASESLGALVDGGFRSNVGYWKRIITDGSYTYGQLKIPTVGYGAGSEDDLGAGLEALGTDKLEKAMYGQALIVHRNIGVPTFGWSSDEI